MDPSESEKLSETGPKMHVVNDEDRKSQKSEAPLATQSHASTTTLVKSEGPLNGEKAAVKAPGRFDAADVSCPGSQMRTLSDTY